MSAEDTRDRCRIYVGGERVATLRLDLDLDGSGPSVDLTPDNARRLGEALAHAAAEIAYEEAQREEAGATRLEALEARLERLAVVEARS